MWTGLGINSAIAPRKLRINPIRLAHCAILLSPFTKRLSATTPSSDFWPTSCKRWHGFCGWHKTCAATATPTLGGPGPAPGQIIMCLTRRNIYFQFPYVYLVPRRERTPLFRAKVGPPIRKRFYFQKAYMTGPPLGQRGPFSRPKTGPIQAQKLFFQFLGVCLEVMALGQKRPI